MSRRASDDPRRFRPGFGLFRPRLAMDAGEDPSPPRWRHPRPGVPRTFPMRAFGVDWMLQWTEGAPGPEAERVDTAGAQGPFCPRCGNRLREARAGSVLGVLPRTEWRCDGCGRGFRARVRGTEEARRVATARGLAALYPAVKRMGDI